MRMSIASDHQGVEIKKQISDYLKKQNYEVTDIGTYENKIINFPDYAEKASRLVIDGEVDLAILFCGTGIGMSIAANKVKGIRCAKLNSKRDAYYAKNHNNANALAFSSKTSKRKIVKMINTFLNTTFSNVERYEKRNEIISEIENGN